LEISPDQGERGQSEPSPTGKTSMWPFMMSRGPLGVPQVKSLTTFGMEGWGAMISGVMPWERRYLVITSAAKRVSPGGFGEGA
jgi:hypothetical protein